MLSVVAARDLVWSDIHACSVPVKLKEFSA